MRFLRVFAAGLLAAGALFGLFVALCCILPKVAQAEIDLHTTLPSWISPLTSLSVNGNWTLDLIYLLAALLLAVFVLALLPFIKESGRRVACGILYSLAFGTSILAIFLLTVASAGMIFVNGDLYNKNRIYASTLNQFTLLESANGRFDQIQSLDAKLSSAKLIEVKDASALSEQQRGEQIKGIFYGLENSKDVTFLKQLLATSDQFRTSITKNPYREKSVLSAATLCGAPADNIDAFYAWLEPKIGTDGWNNLPLHVLVFEK